MFCAERQFFDSPLGASDPADIYTKFHYYRGLRNPYKSGTQLPIQMYKIVMYKIPTYIESTLYSVTYMYIFEIWKYVI